MLKWVVSKDHIHMRKEQGHPLGKMSNETVLNSV